MRFDVIPDDTNPNLDDGVGLPPAPVLVPEGPDAGLVWHLGSPLREQRVMAGGAGVLALANREVLEFDAPRWELEDLPGLRLSTDGRWAHADPGWGEALVPRLRAALGLGVWRRRDLTVLWRGSRLDDPAGAVARNPSPVPDGVEWILPASGEPPADAAPGRSSPGEGARPVGLWAYEALRIAAGVPRVGLDIPLDDAAAGRAGRPVRLLLEADELPPVGAPLTLDGHVVGRLGASAQHHEWGPVALAWCRADPPRGAVLVVDQTCRAVPWPT